MPLPEAKLWLALRNKQLGIKFRRQHGIGNYIVDFYSNELQLIIEIDGDDHFYEQKKIKDTERTAFFNRLGLTVIRFNNKEIMENLEGVIEYLRTFIKIKQ